MAHNARRNGGHDQKRFNSVLIEFYSIDRLLSLYEHPPKVRPGYAQLIEILIEAAKGDFTLSDRFIQRLEG